MKKTTLILIAFYLASSTTISQSQSLSRSIADNLLKKGAQFKLNEQSGLPDFVTYRSAEAPVFHSPALFLRKTFELGPEFDFIQLSADRDQLGFTHYRYQLTYNKCNVIGSTYSLHVKNNSIISMNGMLPGKIETLVPVAMKPSLALQLALNYMDADIYKWEVDGEEEWLKREQHNPDASFYPQGKLVYTIAKYENVNNYKLAYQFDIYSQEPLMRKYIYVDALTGETINSEDRICETNVTGTAMTAYSGTQSIVTDSTLGSYRLREAPRGAGLGVETYNMQQGTSYASAVDFTDIDNIWNNVNVAKDQYATDAHFAAEKTYDYLNTTYGRNSIDNAGLKLLNYVHYSSNYVNAYWDGSRMTYGDGNASYTPLTSLDIGGHEITHGLTQYTANLNYSYQSGALNESFSDIIGETIESWAKGTPPDWLMGAAIGSPFRSFSNPNAYGDPDTYLGTNWYTGIGDNGGVHTNSGVQNFWYYLLTNGGAGTNDIGNAYSVSGIGITKASAIAYRTLTVYLTSGSQYADARFYSVQAAIDLFGSCSVEAMATANAWYAVGIGSTSIAFVTSNGPTTFCTGGSVTLTASASGATIFQWNNNGIPIAGATASSYIASQNGSYTVTMNVCGTFTSAPIVVVVNAAPVASITAGGPTTFCAGGNVLLSATPTGAGYTYQWRINSNDINGATNATFLANNVGNYDVIVSIGICASTSNVIGVNIIGISSLTLQPDGANGMDAVIHGLSQNAGLNFGNSFELNSSAWTVLGVLGLVRSLIRFDLSALPANAVVQQSTISLYFDPSSSNGTQHSSLTGSNISWLQKVISPWNENTVTWNQQPTTTSIGQVTVPQSTTPHQDYTIDITNLVQDMVSNPSTNFGLMIKQQTEIQYRTLLFAASDHPIAEKHPKLIINYYVPLIAGITSTGTTVCPGSNIVLNATPVGLTYQWQNNGVNINGANAVSLNTTVAGIYRCIISNSCTNDTSNNIVVTQKNLPATPGTISGVAKPCPGDSGVPYSVIAVANTTTYKWIMPTGASIATGSGTNIITVNFSPSFVSGIISVQAGNECGFGVARNKSVSRNIPGTPGTITGPINNLCKLTVTFSINAVNTATAYNWSVPAGSIIISGQNTTSISVAFPNNFTTGAISVSAGNACGFGTVKALTVRGAPATPASITGPSTVCVNQLNVTYTTTPVAGAVSYSWLVPAGATISSGQGTLSIVVKFGTAGGNIRVRSVNSCGNSSYKSQAVANITCRASSPLVEDALGLTIFPNPSNNNFMLTINNTADANFDLLVRDITGRLVASYYKIDAHLPFAFGKELAGGIYIADVLQGTNHKVIRLVKSR